MADRYERRPGEEPPIGLILCGEKDREQIEPLLDRVEIRGSTCGAAQGDARGQGWRRGRLRRVQRDDVRHGLSSINPNLMFL
jgi:hypothetical protein